MSLAPPPTMVAPEAPDAAAYRAPATDLLAIVAMCASAAGLSLLPVLGSLAGIVIGAIASARIGRLGTGGRPLARWAVVLGAVGVVVWTALGVELVVFVAAIVATLPAS